MHFFFEGLTDIHIVYSDSRRTFHVFSNRYIRAKVDLIIMYTHTHTHTHTQVVSLQHIAAHCRESSDAS